MTRKELVKLVESGKATAYEAASYRVNAYLQENGRFMGRNEVIRVATILAKDWNLNESETTKLKEFAIYVYIRL